MFTSVVLRNNTLLNLPGMKNTVNLLPLELPPTSTEFLFVLFAFLCFLQWNLEPLKMFPTRVHQGGLAGFQSSVIRMPSNGKKKHAILLLPSIDF